MLVNSMDRKPNVPQKERKTKQDMVSIREIHCFEGRRDQKMQVTLDP